MKKNSFGEDKIFESNVMAFLENAGVLKALHVAEIVTDRERQLKGIDLIDEDGNYIDVKSVASLTLPTFCFELENLTSGKYGWFINPEVLTDKYLLTYHKVGHPNATGNYAIDKELLTPDNIVRSEFILISKKAVNEIVIEMLHPTATLDELYERFIRVVKILIKRENCQNKNKRYSLCPDGWTNGERFVDTTVYKPENEGLPPFLLRLSYSGTHDEHPINLVIPKGELIKKAEKHWFA